ncbi:MAG: tRNA uridine-5-carboxymethylaminomethyl(34) synthesis GTPase MnmE [Rhizobiaceae bacterium]|nr:tRNA uridine-5-carboxymethylaminomethyl(34) synthesis GTPase MnmE [Rhizobiaceae bacterium]
MTDTIFALSSGALPSGVALIRVSGSRVRDILMSICGLVPQPRLAHYCKISSPEGDEIDRGLVMFFENPRSFTGEDVAELHLHGGRAVVARMLNVLAAFSGVRQAEQGEFTKRAFLNGKLDLTEAEALADLIEAQTEAQRRFALLNAGGGQKELYESWRTQLISSRALLEAELDFSDQEDVPGSVSDSVLADLSHLVRSIEEHIATFHRAEIIRDGFDVVIVGAPNAGKSSLLNALTRRDVALVSDEPGTTRDLIEVALDLNGIKVRVTDTAGIREGAGKVETLGIERAKERASKADLVLHLRDLTSAGPIDEFPDAVKIGTKADLFDAISGDLVISTQTGQGISALLDLIERRARDALGRQGDLLPSRERHISLLKNAVGHLRDALGGYGGLVELQAEALRYASDEVGKVTGRVDVEDILDVIFSRFCIGK